jgi:hypothetical protein
VLRTNIPEITGLTQKILKADDPEKVRELLSHLNS